MTVPEILTLVSMIVVVICLPLIIWNLSVADWNLNQADQMRSGRPEETAPFWVRWHKHGYRP